MHAPVTGCVQCKAAQLSQEGPRYPLPHCLLTSGAPPLAVLTDMPRHRSLGGGHAPATEEDSFATCLVWGGGTQIRSET